MIPINEKMLSFGEHRSVIRDVFEYGNERRKKVGKENVFDFSIGNPSVPAPREVNGALGALLRLDPCEVHGYTSAAGDPSVRDAVASYVNEKYGSKMSGDNIYMTCGAAASLALALNAVINRGDEVILFAPYFPEYLVFAEKAGADVVCVKCCEDDLTIDVSRLEKAISPKTKAVIINSPNNPTGVVISGETLSALARVLKKKSDEYGHIIYLISDEPYRELVYDENTKVPFVPDYYGETVICYSFSKSLSLPGERIGYVAVSERATDWKTLFSAICGAGRALGYVCAPSIFQKIIPLCLGKTADLSIYKKNRDILVRALKEYGYSLASPDGAFYLFVKSPENNATAFCERAKKYDLLFVPSDGFGYDGYARIAYCVDTDTVLRSLPAFKALADEYKNK